jgi:ferredoxin-NADP reductase
MTIAPTLERPLAGNAGRAAGMVDLRVASRRMVATDVALLELVAAGGRPLPDWTPGAHIDIAVGTAGMLRQYSLCGDPRDTSRYWIAVLREADGRGGSVAIHDTCIEGALVSTRPPRNNFALADAPHVVFIAGGIGITPFLPMIGAVERAGRSWELHYAGRSLASMAFAEELPRWHGGRTILYPSAEGRRLDIGVLFDGLLQTDAVYACGPSRLLADVEARCAERGMKPRLERFTAPDGPPRDPLEDEAFEVELARTGVTLTIAAGQSILDAAEKAGADVVGSCLEGVCGTCETRVLAGIPEHRDYVLDGADTGTMMICVSRAACPKLVLDI